MGATDSKQKLGEKVIAARKKLEEHKEIQSDRFKYFESNSPETIKVMLKSIDKSFKKCSPFLEHTLLIAYQSDPENCQQFILQSCKKVLSAPIINDEYKWFKQYVLPSSIWFYKINKNKYMFEELFNIVQNMSQEIISSMNSIYSLFQSHPKWKQLMNIKNETKISRQDHEKVGLLKEKGITDILDLKEETEEDMQTFIDSNLSVNILTTTAKEINGEFQNHMKRVMSHYGIVKSGPLKNVERCQSKLENDYQSAVFPKAAKLLDLVRCSVTFNTLDQLMDGYQGLISHINSNPSMVELSRIKNGFLDPNYNGGYRDIKINVVYHSPINPELSMICEVQLLLLNYLHEKKRIHKLYSIARQELYFRMVVKTQDENNNIVSKNMKDLKLIPILKVDNNIQMSDTTNVMYKCSVDTDLRLLGMENKLWFECVDMDSKQVIFEEKVTLDQKGRHCHNWILINNEKHVTIQTSLNTIKMFKILKKNNNKFEFKENEAYRISCNEKDVINFCEFDKNFENIFIVKNAIEFQQRLMKDVNTITTKIKLEEKIDESSYKQLSLSDDGTICAIGGERTKNFFYIIDIQNKKQYKLTSKVLGATYNPRFINGDTQFIAINDRKRKVEIWDIAKKTAIRIIDIGKNEFITSMTATNNILAVAGWDNILRLYDVRNWEQFYCESVEVGAYSIHLTSDSRYLTIGGQGTGYGRTRKCVVLEIK